MERLFLVLKNISFFVVLSECVVNFVIKVLYLFVAFFLFLDSSSNAQTEISEALTKYQSMLHPVNITGIRKFVPLFGVLAIHLSALRFW